MIDEVIDRMFRRNCLAYFKMMDDRIDWDGWKTDIGSRQQDESIIDQRTKNIVRGRNHAAD